MSGIKVNYSFVSPSRIKVEVQNTLGSNNAKKNSNAAMGRSNSMLSKRTSSNHNNGAESVRGGKSGDQPCSVIFSLRCSHPELFYHLASKSEGDHNSLGSTAESGTGWEQSDAPRTSKSGKAHGEDGQENEESTTMGNPDITRESDRTWRQIERELRTPLAALGKKKDGHDSFRHDGSEARPLLVCEEIPDGVLLPGERRVLFFEIDDPVYFASLFKHHPHPHPTKKSGSSSRGNSRGTSVSSLGKKKEAERRSTAGSRPLTAASASAPPRLPAVELASANTSNRDLSTPLLRREATRAYPATASSSNAASIDVAACEDYNSKVVEERQQRKSATPNERLWSSPETDEDISTENGTQLSIVRNSAMSPERTARQRLEDEEREKARLDTLIRRKKREDEKAEQQLQNLNHGSSDQEDDDDEEGDGVLTGATTEYANSSVSTRLRNSILDQPPPQPTLFVFYERLGDEDKCVEVARKWLRKERKKYDQWRESYMQQIVELEQKRRSDMRMRHFHGKRKSSGADANSASRHSQRRLSSGASIKNENAIHRIVPPALGEPIRWCRNEFFPPEQSKTANKGSYVSLASFGYFYGYSTAAGDADLNGTSTLRTTSSLGSSGPRSPPPFFSSVHTHNMSKTAQKMFKSNNNRIGGGSAIVPIRGYRFFMGQNKKNVMPSRLFGERVQGTVAAEIIDRRQPFATSMQTDDNSVSAADDCKPFHPLRHSLESSSGHGRHNSAASGNNSSDFTDSVLTDLRDDAAPLRAAGDSPTSSQRRHHKPSSTGRPTSVPVESIPSFRTTHLVPDSSTDVNTSSGNQIRSPTDVATRGVGLALLEDSALSTSNVSSGLWLSRKEGSDPLRSSSGGNGSSGLRTNTNTDGSLSPPRRAHFSDTTAGHDRGDSHSPRDGAHGHTRTLDPETAAQLLGEMHPDSPANSPEDRGAFSLSTSRATLDHARPATAPTAITLSGAPAATGPCGAPASAGSTPLTQPAPQYVDSFIKMSSTSRSLMDSRTVSDSRSLPLVLDMHGENTSDSDHAANDSSRFKLINQSFLAFSQLFSNIHGRHGAEGADADASANRPAAVAAGRPTASGSSSDDDGGDDDENAHSGVWPGQQPRNIMTAPPARMSKVAVPNTSFSMNHRARLSPDDLPAAVGSAAAVAAMNRRKSKRGAVGAKGKAGHHTNPNATALQRLLAQLFSLFHALLHAIAWSLDMMIIWAHRVMPYVVDGVEAAVSKLPAVVDGVSSFYNDMLFTNENVKMLQTVSMPVLGVCAVGLVVGMMITGGGVDGDSGVLF